MLINLLHILTGTGRCPQDVSPRRVNVLFQSVMVSGNAFNMCLSSTQPLLGVLLFLLQGDNVSLCSADILPQGISYWSELCLLCLRAFVEADSIQEQEARNISLL
jgi:hypothetical protein